MMATNNKSDVSTIFNKKIFKSILYIIKVFFGVFFKLIFNKCCSFQIGFNELKITVTSWQYFSKSKEVNKIFFKSLGRNSVTLEILPQKPWKLDHFLCSMPSFCFAPSVLEKLYRPLKVNQNYLNHLEEIL